MSLLTKATAPDLKGLEQARAALLALVLPRGEGLSVVDAAVAALAVVRVERYGETVFLAELAESAKEFGAVHKE